MCTLYNLIYENDSSKSYFKPNFQYMEVVHEHESSLNIPIKITTTCGENELSKVSHRYKNYRLFKNSHVMF